MKDAHISTITTMALLLTLSAGVAQAAPAGHGDMFQMSEVQGAQLAMGKGTADATMNADGIKPGNKLMNNKFTEHVCAAHVFHPKRKAMEAKAIKAKKAQG